MAPPINTGDNQSPSASKRRLDEETDIPNSDPQQGEIFIPVTKKKSIKLEKANQNNDIESMELGNGDQPIAREKTKKVRVPPIKIIPPDNWQILLLEIKRRAKTAQSKMKGRYLTIKFDNVDDYRQIQSYLLKENVQFQSYVLDDAKPIRAVLRGYPSTQPSRTFLMSWKWKISWMSL